MTKHCNCCNTTKEVTLFGKDKWAKDGYTDYCKECRNAKSRERAKLKPEIYKVRNEKHKESRKKYYSLPENKRKFKSLALKKSFGISIEDYEQLLIKQDYKCKICNGTETSMRNRNLAVDHCHSTGKIRGLLCSHCNRAIGLLKDNVAVINNALNYLKENK